MRDHTVQILPQPGNPDFPYLTLCSCAFQGHARNYAQADYFKRSHQHAHGIEMDAAQLVDPALAVQEAKVEAEVERVLEVVQSDKPEVVEQVAAPAEVAADAPAQEASNTAPVVQQEQAHEEGGEG